jgi:kynurenine 3-monooxygenase
MSEKKKITISGSGLVGSLLGVYMKRRGHDVTIYERRPDLRNSSISGGKSINLALSNRGWKALAEVGLDGAIREVAIPMYKRVMHAVDGSLTDQPYGKDDEAIFSVSRGGLNEKMMTLAEENGVEIKFDHKCLSVDLDNATAVFEGAEGEAKVEADVLFGADGAFSAVRSVMQKTDRFNYQQEYIEHGYKELEIPANPDGTHKLEKNALHIWPRGQYMLIALPNMDGSFTCTLFFPWEGKPSFNSIQNDQDVMDFFNAVFPDVVPLMPDLVEEYFENPTASLCIIRCFPWTYKDKVALIGDAAHAIVPFYGQGMNAGFEDCSVLNAILDDTNEDWMNSFKKYEIARKPNGDAIAELSKRNFIVMRDLTGDPKFLLQKKIEKRFSEKYPDRWMPLYSQVTFSHIPYHEALAAGIRQDKLMEEIMAIPNIEEKWDSDEVERRMLELSSLHSLN